MNIKQIIDKKLSETFNPNDIAWGPSSDFMAKLHKARHVDNVTGEKDDSILDAIQELKNAIIENDDEVDIEFEDGKFIRLDIEIVKYMLANFSDEQIYSSLESHESLTDWLHVLYDVIDKLDDEEVEDKIETALGKD